MEFSENASAVKANTAVRHHREQMENDAADGEAGNDHDKFLLFIRLRCR